MASPSDPPWNQIQGTYRAAESVGGILQSFEFSDDRGVVYQRQKTCVTERDQGRAQLLEIAGERMLVVRLEKGWALDESFGGRGCPPLVPLAPDRMTPMADPFPFRWILQDRSFEIRVSPIAWMRFDKI